MIPVRVLIELRNFSKSQALDVLARLTDTPEDVVAIDCRVRLEEDVVTDETGHLVAIATLGKVGGDGALGVGLVGGSDGEA